MTDFQEILDFWFADLDAPDQGPMIKRWYSADPALDALLQERFGMLLTSAESGGLQDWEAEPMSLLALVILIDQFSRNLHRGSGQAFANDARAVSLARRAVEQGWDQSMHPLHRVFLYMPFEHSEDIADQNKAVALFERLAQEVPADQKQHYLRFLDYAEGHREIIARFGRFPARNARLGRTSTPEEAEFLTLPGSSFG